MNAKYSLILNRPPHELNKQDQMWESGPPVQAQDYRQSRQDVHLSRTTNGFIFKEANRANSSTEIMVPTCQAGRKKQPNEHVKIFLKKTQTN